MNEAAPIDRIEGVRPVVRTGYAGNRSLLVFGGFLLLAGLLLFQALNARRQDGADSQLPTVSNGTITAPPPLALPPDYAQTAQEPWSTLGRAEAAPSQPVAVPASAPPQIVTRVVERFVPTAPQVEAAPLFTPRPAVVFADDARGSPSSAAPADQSAERVQAGRLLNPALTVAKGTVIPAVLETALDSTRPGPARAIVSRDVMGFDGTRVVIPRGSRLYGEYEADLSAGQKRALIRWQRLIRPDAVIVSLDSPSADQLGRAGIGGRVNNHFLARFGSSILQSVLDIGVGLATREATDGVIVALPGSTQNVTGVQQQVQIQPTLRVRQGASVSVFVARDLDFSTVDR